MNEERAQLGREIQAFIEHIVDEAGGADGPGLSLKAVARRLIENPRFAPLLALRGAFAYAEQYLPEHLTTVPRDEDEDF